MPKLLRNDVREVVLKVKDFFMKEKQSSAPIIPFERVDERVAAAIGISLRTIVRIGNEGRLAEASSSIKKLEEKYRKKYGYLDEPFIIQLCSESEESSDDDDSQDEDLEE